VLLFQCIASSVQFDTSIFVAISECESTLDWDGLLETNTKTLSEIESDEVLAATVQNLIAAGLIDAHGTLLRLHFDVGGEPRVDCEHGQQHSPRRER